MKAILMIAALALTACQTTPNVPETVTVVVEKYKPLPEWATTPITAAKPPKATTGREYLRRESALDALVDYVLGIANCDRRLLAKLDKGEPVDRKECGKP